MAILVAQAMIDALPRRLLCSFSTAIGSTEGSLTTNNGLAEVKVDVISVALDVH